MENPPTMSQFADKVSCLEARDKYWQKENAKLREQLIFAESSASLWKERAEAAEAKLKEASEPEPFGEMKENGVEWFGRNPHAFPVGTKFYAAPIPHAELQSKNTALEIAVRNGLREMAAAKRKGE